MQDFREKTKAFTWISAIAGFGIAVYVYLWADLASARIGRVDLTRNSQYTLSDVTRKTLRSLKDTLSVKVYFSRDVEAEKELRRQVKDILKDFSSAAPGNIQVVYPDMQKETQQRLARDLGIQKVRSVHLEEGRASVVECYRGLAIFYAGKYDVIADLKQVTNSLEYNLLTMIKKLSREKIPEVAIAVAEKETQPNPLMPLKGEQFKQKYERIRNKLSQQYDVQWVDLTRPGVEIDKKFTTAVVIAPATAPEQALKAINDFVMSGRRVVLFTSSAILLPGMTGVLERPSVAELVAKWGAKVETGLVRDYGSHFPLPINTRVGRVSIGYPYAVRIGPRGFSDTHAAVAHMQQEAFLWPSPVVPENVPETVTAEVLVRSSAKSEMVTKNLQLNPFMLRNYLQKNPPQDDKLKRYPLAVELKGKFPDYRQPGTVSDNSSVVVVIGTSHILDPRFGSKDVVLLNNMVDYLTLDEELIEVRMKQSAAGNIPPLTPWQVTVFKWWLGIAFMPFLLVVFGVIRLIRRIRRRRRLSSV